MAQVHRAVLKDGTHVVLKVLRPGIREITETDMEIMRTLAHWAESHFSNLGYSPTFSATWPTPTSVISARLFRLSAQLDF